MQRLFIRSGVGDCINAETHSFPGELALAANEVADLRAAHYTFTPWNIGVSVSLMIGFGLSQDDRYEANVQPLGSTGYVRDEVLFGKASYQAEIGAQTSEGHRGQGVFPWRVPLYGHRHGRFIWLTVVNETDTNVSACVELWYDAVKVPLQLALTYHSVTRP